MSDSYMTLWTVARQAPLSMGFSRQEYWSGLTFPSPSPGIEPTSLALSGKFFTAEPPVFARKALMFILYIVISNIRNIFN